jgi:hypothetical protein
MGTSLRRNAEEMQQRIAEERTLNLFRFYIRFLGFQGVGGIKRLCLSGLNGRWKGDDNSLAKAGDHPLVGSKNQSGGPTIGLYYIPFVSDDHFHSGPKTSFGFGSWNVISSRYTLIVNLCSIAPRFL